MLTTKERCNSVSKANKQYKNQMAAAEHKRDVQVRIILTAVLVIFALAVGFFVIQGRDGSADAAAPRSVTDSGAIRAVSPDVELTEGSETPKRVLTIFEDFQCPVCKSFEAAFGGILDELRTSGVAAIDYHPIAILDRMSSTNYSTRAANASVCVADSSVDTWLTFHSSAYAQQPAEGGEGLSDEALGDIATAAGAPDSVRGCIEDGQHEDWVTSSTQSVLDRDINATPTVLLNGEALDLTTPEALSAAVRAIP